MKMLSILAAVAAAGLAVPAATAVAAPAPATISAPAKAVEMQRWGRHHKRMYWRTVCTTKWRHHHRVRVCRKVRAWR